MSNLYYIEFELPGLPMLPNQQLRAGWRKLRAEGAAWKLGVGLMVGPKRPNVPLMRGKVTLTRFSASQPDCDGLMGSFKHVIDGLVDAGVLYDDKPENIGQPVCLWCKAPPKHGKIRVQVMGFIEGGK